MGIYLVALWCAVLAVIDIKYRRLPDVLTLPGALLINLWALTIYPQWMLGGLFWAGIYFLTAVLVGGIGGGRYQVRAWFGDSGGSLGNAGTNGGNCGIIVNFCLTGWNFCGC